MLETIIMQMAMSSGKKVAATIASKVLLNVGACAGSMVISNGISKCKDKKLEARKEAGEFNGDDNNLDPEKYEEEIKKQRMSLCVEQAAVSGLALGAAAVAFNNVSDIIKK